MEERERRYETKEQGERERKEELKENLVRKKNKNKEWETMREIWEKKRSDGNIK